MFMLFKLFYSPQKHIELLEKELNDLLDLKGELTFPNDSVATYLSTPASLDNRIKVIKDLVDILEKYSENDKWIALEKGQTNF